MLNGAVFCCVCFLSFHFVCTHTSFDISAICFKCWRRKRLQFIYMMKDEEKTFNSYTAILYWLYSNRWIHICFSKIYWIFWYLKIFAFEVVVLFLFFLFVCSGKAHLMLFVNKLNASISVTIRSELSIEIPEGSLFSFQNNNNFVNSHSSASIDLLTSLTFGCVCFFCFFWLIIYHQLP